MPIIIIFVYLCVQLYVFKYMFRMIFLFPKQKLDYKIKGAVVTFLFVIFNWSTVPHYHVPRTAARQKACFYNIRTLQGAVEMYNMDHEKDPMKALDMNWLIKDNYLKKEPEYPETACSYHSCGDLSDPDTGEIYCHVHGSLSKPNPDYGNYIDPIPPKSTVKSFTEKLKKSSLEVLRFILISLGIFHLSQLGH